MRNVKDVWLGLTGVTTFYLVHSITRKGFRDKFLVAVYCSHCMTCINSRLIESLSYMFPPLLDGLLIFVNFFVNVVINKSKNGFPYSCLCSVSWQLQLISLQSDLALACFALPCNVE